MLSESSDFPVGERPTRYGWGFGNRVPADPKRKGYPQGTRSSGSWAEYAAQKNAWIRAHPNATHVQIDKAARAIARKLGL